MGVGDVDLSCENVNDENEAEVFGGSSSKLSGEVDGDADVGNNTLLTACKLLALFTSLLLSFVRFKPMEDLLIKGEISGDFKPVLPLLFKAALGGCKNGWFLNFCTVLGVTGGLMDKEEFLFGV